MTEIGFYLYENVPIPEKIRWLTNAIGRGAIEEPRVGLGNLGVEFAESDTSLRDTLSKLGVGWTGIAADNAAQALNRAADRSGSVGSASSTGSGSVDEYGLSFEELRQRFQLKDPGTWDFWDATVDFLGGPAGGILDVFDVQSDYSATMENNRNLEAAANTALRNHEYSSRFALSGFPALDPDAPLTSGGADGGAGGGGSGGNVPGGPGAGSGGVGGGVGQYSSPAAGLGVDGGPAPTGTASVGTPPMTSGGASSGLGPLGGSGAGGALAPGVGGGVAAPVHAPQGIAPGGWGGPALGGASAAGTGRSGALSPPSSTGWAGGQSGLGGSATGWGPTATGGGYGSAGSGRGAGGIGSGSRGGTSGSEFANRLGSGSPESTGQRPAGSSTPGGSTPVGRTGSHGAPMMGGMGGGAGGGATEHKRKYWIPSSEHFDSGLPPHTDPVIGGSAEWL